MWLFWKIGVEREMPHALPYCGVSTPHIYIEGIPDSIVDTFVAIHKGFIKEDDHLTRGIWMLVLCVLRQPEISA